jgi:uncharacterized phage protein (TIGR02218 family)
MPPTFEAPLSTIALCWRIERADGAGLALTSHDEPLCVGATVFEAAPGILPSAVQHKAGLEANGAEVAGAISSAAIAEEDLLLGRWDGARVRMTAVDWELPDAGEVALMKGELGDVRLERGEFTAELRGAAARLDAPICPETSPECRAELGDKKCRVDLAGRTMIAAVVSAEGSELVLDQGVSGDFLWGRVRFLTGGNCGLASVLVAADGSRVSLRDMPRAEIAAGDRLELRHGCDKSFATCTGRFANAENFRGEPHLPGNDLLTRYPGA